MTDKNELALHYTMQSIHGSFTNVTRVTESIEEMDVEIAVGF